MTVPVIPKIGIRGYYEFDAPYDTITSNSQSLTCIAIRTLKDINLVMTNAYETIYNNFGLDKSVYDNDLANNVVIASFITDDNNYYYIPTEYITKAVDTNGYLYKNNTISFDLGLLREDIDLTALTTLLSGIIKDYLGVNAVGQNYSGPVTKHMSVADANTYETSLANNKTLYKTYYQLYQEQLDINNLQNQALTDMANYLKANGFI